MVTLLLLLPAGWLVAQSPTPSPRPTPPKPKVGHVRFFNATPVSADLTFDLVSGGASDGRLLGSASPANFYVGYINLAPDRYHLQVFRHGDRQNPIKSFDLLLRDKSYFTLLATQISGDQPAIELIDDTPDPTKPPSNRATLRQYCPDIMAAITATGNYRSDPLSYGKTQTLEGLPDGIVVLHMQATKTGSAAKRVWDSEADFRTARHSTLFIANDVYGRLRARVTMDGPSPAEEAEAAEEAKSTP